MGCPAITSKCWLFTSKLANASVHVWTARENQIYVQTRSRLVVAGGRKIFVSEKTKNSFRSDRPSPGEGESTVATLPCLSLAGATPELPLFSSACKKHSYRDPRRLPPATTFGATLIGVKPRSRLRPQNHGYIGSRLFAANLVAR
jgi:hypothetical protein